VTAAELFIAGRVATRDYLDCAPPGGVEVLRERGARWAALTAGADGAYLLDGPQSVRIPASSIDAIGTTGAGDAFTAGLIHA